MQKNAPIILLGMHRSGTSMIAGMLEELGLFMGNHKDRNNEAFLFMKLNESSHYTREFHTRICK